MELLVSVLQNPIVLGAIAGIAWAISAWSKKTGDDGKMIGFSFKRMLVSLGVGALMGVVAQTQGVAIDSLTELVALFGAVVGGENGLKLLLRQGPGLLKTFAKPLLAKAVREATKKKGK